ncbi:hypothetical protein HDE_07967 [Halotydeus destructor]|nr:hypothetical protein HDE_07967 [Halotydeus destructor]
MMKTTLFCLAAILVTALNVANGAPTPDIGGDVVSQDGDTVAALSADPADGVQTTTPAEASSLAVAADVTSAPTEATLETEATESTVSPDSAETGPTTATPTADSTADPTADPTSEAPTSEAPTPEAPTTAAPTSEAPTSETPNSEAPGAAVLEPSSQPSDADATSPVGTLVNIDVNTKSGSLDATVLSTASATVTTAIDGGQSTVAKLKATGSGQGSTSAQIKLTSGLTQVPRQAATKESVMADSTTNTQVPATLSSQAEAAQADENPLPMNANPGGLGSYMTDDQPAQGARDRAVDQNPAQLLTNFFGIGPARFESMAAMPQQSLRQQMTDVMGLLLTQMSQKLVKMARARKNANHM